MDNDLVIGSNYNTNTGRAYIFNNDGSYPNLATNSDIKIGGESTNNYFSNSFTKGDFNNDNRIDLVVGAYYYSSGTGRAYIFYNDGSIPTTAATADVIITGESTYTYFGFSVTGGDFNADGKTDLAVGAYGFLSNKGSSYIFFGDGSISTLAKDADAIIGGNANGDKFGIANIAGDFDGNNKTNLCVGYIGANWQGGFYIYEVDAEGTKPDYVENNGSVKYNGSVLIR